MKNAETLPYDAITVGSAAIMIVLGLTGGPDDATLQTLYANINIIGTMAVISAIAISILSPMIRIYRAKTWTMAFLIGLILGSLWVLWPFKEVAEGAKIVTGTNILPAAFDSEVIWSAVALLVGLVCSAGMFYMGKAPKK